VHLLQTADDHAYIHLLTELARTGEKFMIRYLWFIAQITCNPLKVISARPPPASHHLGMSASYQQGQGKNPSAYNKPAVTCEWCGAPHHDMEKCYSRDTTNIRKYPSPNWINGEPPEFILKKYCKNSSKNEAQNMIKASRQARFKRPVTPAKHQANVAWTSPHIYSPVPASTSTPTPPQRPASPILDLYSRARSVSRYDFVPELEDLATPQRAMPARTADDSGDCSKELRYKWLIDSGATCHISNDLSHFRSLDTKPSLPCSVTYGNGDEVMASGVGTVRFVTETKEVLTLTGVLWVPSQAMSLFSVKEVSGHGGTTVFQDEACMIYKDKVPLFTRRPHSHSNYLSSDLIIKHKNPESLLPPGFLLGPTAMAARVKYESAELWHARFAHLSWTNIEKLIKKNLVRGMNVDPKEIHGCIGNFCEECTLANSKTKPSPKSTSPPTTQMLQVLHTDIMGPMPVNSYDGKKYILTVYDDYSKLASVVCLKSKDEAPVVLIAICNQP
jgi:hypothetical protein